MTDHPTRRLCLDARDMRHLERDGLGWGHDLDCGCLDMPAPRSLLGRAFARLLKRS